MTNYLKDLHNLPNNAKKPSSKSKAVSAKQKNPTATSSEPAVAPIGAPLEDASRANRPKRIPLAAQNRLGAPTRSGYARRIVNDTDDRIERFKKAGWAIVEGDFPIGDERSKDPSLLGKQRRTAVGHGTNAFLMEIPEEWYNADQEAKVRERQRKMDELLRKKPNQYGAININTDTT